jgi:serine/threonine protein kinase
LTDISIPSNLSTEGKEFIGRLIRKSPEDRLSAEEALKSPLITQYFDEDL